MTVRVFTIVILSEAKDLRLTQGEKHRLEILRHCVPQNDSPCLYYCHPERSEGSLTNAKGKAQA